MYQQNLFNINDEEQINLKREEILSKLEHYGIDEIYAKEFKGKTPLLREIYERLSSVDKYNAYMNDLISELLKIVPLLNSKNMFQGTGIFEYENGWYGYTMGKYEVDGVTYFGCQSPLYCLEMLPKHFFKVGD
jgi:hypothetical protein